MTYDHSSGSAQLLLPNPYKLQNRLMLVAAAVLVAGGLLALWWARQALMGADGSGSLLPLAVGLLLLSAGIAAGARAASRLRFFFGRGRPASLAPEIRPGTTGNSPGADRHKEWLRQGAITYPEPQGAIQGALYHWVPRLITAPDEVQTAAKAQFFNLTALVATLASFALAYLLTPEPEVRAWLSIGYAAFAFYFLLRPLVRHATAGVTWISLVGLVAAALLAPVLIRLIGARLPSLGGFSLELQVGVMLVGALVAVALAVLAVLAQVNDPPTTQASAMQVRLSLNAPPSALLDELDRHLQDQWSERIPNRRYARQEPVIDPARHAAPFAGELFEETQPMPLGHATAPSLGVALASRRHRWLVCLDLFALLLVVLAVAAALYVCSHLRLDADWRSGAYRLLGVAGILLLLAAYVQSTAAKLWGRFDFESVLTWVEFAGTYQTSSIGVGNQLTSRVNTQSQVVRTESMTLRVWRARIESVVFGKDGVRQVTAMFSTDAEAKSLAAHLADFGEGQGSVVAPMSREDARRLGAVGQAEQWLAGGRSANALHAELDAVQKLGAAAGLGAAGPDGVGAGAGSMGLDAVGAAAGGVATPSGAAVRHCSACGATLAAQARFCSACGASVETAGASPTA
jgi:hypothetical protein